MLNVSNYNRISQELWSRELFLQRTLLQCQYAYVAVYMRIAATTFLLEQQEDDTVGAGKTACESGNIIPFSQHVR